MQMETLTALLICGLGMAAGGIGVYLIQKEEYKRNMAISFLLGAGALGKRLGRSAEDVQELLFGECSPGFRIEMDDHGLRVTEYEEEDA